MILAETFVAVDIDGRLANKSQFLAGIRDPGYQPSKAVGAEIHAEMNGDSAVTKEIFRIEEVQNGKTVFPHERFVDTSVKQGQTWQFVASQITLIPAQ